MVLGGLVHSLIFALRKDLLLYQLNPLLCTI